jgi:3-oxoacyl-[acyl-carrier protein] reductase
VSAPGRFSGKVALVTGGSRGIGRAVVVRLAGEGAAVHFTYRSSAEEARALAASLTKSGRVTAVECDVRKKDAIDAAVDALVEKEGRLDILVNSAGIIRDGLFLSLSEEDWSEVLDTNLGGTWHFCKAAARQMMAQRSGRIVNLSSIVGGLGGYGQANYAASKGAINALTKSLACELASRGITVNAVSPGMVRTDMSEAARSAFGDKIREKIPLGSFAEPEEIAAAVAFLASDEARYITGQVITVDGGISLLGRR